MLAQILRIHPEPYEYVDEQTVHGALTADPRDYLQFLEASLQEVAQGRLAVELPPKTIFSDGPGKGDFRVMPCVVRGEHTAVKTVKIVGTNLQQVAVPDQVTVGRAFCLHPEENYITHIFEACLLSSARTGASAALAIKQLAADRSKVAIVGSGRVAFYTALYVAALGGTRELVFQDLRPQRAELLARWAGRELKPAIHCRVTAEKKIEDSDVVILATTSMQPFCSPQDVRAPVVVSLGADTQEQRELEPRWAEEADIYVDSPDCAKVGDLGAWISQGIITAPAALDWLTLWRHAPGRSRARRCVFISTGSGLLDNFTIRYLLERKAGAGSSNPGCSCSG